MREDLVRRLESLVGDSADEQAVAHKVRAVIDRVRTDFRGDVSGRIEDMIEDMLLRQARIVATADCSPEALNGLRDSQQRLLATLYEVLLRLVPDRNATRH